MVLLFCDCCGRVFWSDGVLLYGGRIWLYDEGVG